MELLGFAPAFLIGATWTPPGIGMFSWSEADGFSGTLVGEFDGLLRPPLNLSLGCAWRRTAITGGLGVAAIRDGQYQDESSQRYVAGVRPSADVRWYLRERAPGKVEAFGLGGIYGIIPAAGDRSDAYTPEEQTDADEAASAQRARIGGLGARLGLGADWLLMDRDGKAGVGLGVQSVLKVHGAWEVGEEDGLRVSTLWLTETSLMLDFYL